MEVVAGSAVDLPEPKPGTRFVVSRIIAEACPDRTDLLVPDDLVRDIAGRIVAGEITVDKLDRPATSAHPSADIMINETGGHRKMITQDQAVDPG